MNSLPAKPVSNVALMDPDAFNHMQRVGSMLALSPLFPEHLRNGSKEIAIANGVLVMNMAMRLNEDPLTVAQNIYFVSGKPGWSSSYMIGKANQHGVFKNPISWEVKGSGDDLAVTAFAELSATGKRVSVTCDMAMAKAENWTKNPKYKSMPQQMLRYRSATFLIRLYCPEVMIGVPAQVEIEMGMKDVTPSDFADTVVNHERVADAPDEDGDGDGVDTNEKSTEAPHNAETGEVVEQTDVKPEIAAAEKWQKIIELINSDLVDATDPEEVLDLYGAQLEQMKQEAPSLHSDLMKAITHATNSGGST